MSEHQLRADKVPSYKYDLSDDQISDLTDRLVNSKDFATDEKFAIYRVAGTDEFSDIGRQIEREVFEETFPGNDAALMEREYGPYEQASLFFLSVDREQKEPVGVLRVIRNSAAGLKTINDLSLPDSPVRLTEDQIKAHHNIHDLDDCWDVGTVAVPVRYRKTMARAALQLYRGWYVSSLQENVDHVITIMDKRPLEVLTDYLGVPLVPMCGTDYFSYLDSAQSRAMYGFVPEFYSIVKQRYDSMQDDPYLTGALDVLMNGSLDKALLFDDYKK